MTGWLSGEQIELEVEAGRIVIEPFTTTALNPNSYNYTIGKAGLVLVSPVLDMRLADEFEELHLDEDRGLLLKPGECYLLHTAERFGSEHFASLITGRSSVGRKFVTNHVTAGLIDVGFVGQITLEVTVQRPTRVYCDMPFGQIFWFTLYGQVTNSLYGGRYQGQSGPTSSRAHL